LAGRGGDARTLSSAIGSGRFIVAGSWLCCHPLLVAGVGHRRLVGTSIVLRSMSVAAASPQGSRRTAAPRVSRKRGGMNGAAAAPDTPADVPRGLVYVSDDRPGIRRVRKGEGFVYRTPEGRPVRDKAMLERIRKLAVPPAYEDVWICPDPRGHLQATGRDARGRKQYRYHPQWRLARDADKFERMLEFGAVLPRIRKRVEADLAGPVGERPRRETVLATLVRLLDTTLVRVGNDEYARTNRSYGLTTLRNRHAAVEGSTLHLRFRGKSGILHEVALEDPRVARVVRRCQAMPGQDLFTYEDVDGTTRSVGSAEVNDYIRATSGAEFTAKDFRTWHGTVHALALWAEQMAAEAAARLSANQVLAEVARRLGNTVAVCRKAYVHPRVLAVLATQEAEAAAQLAARPHPRREGLEVAERRLLAFLGEAA
jgi:DNA topoisomerase-1